MIIELKEVFQKLEQLTDEEQRIIAKMLHDEIQFKIIVQHTEETIILPKEIVDEYRSGKIKEEYW